MPDNQYRAIRATRARRIVPTWVRSLSNRGPQHRPAASRVKSQRFYEMGVKFGPSGNHSMVKYPAATKGTAMGLGDKIKNAGEEAAGKVKETTGRATDNQSLEAEGRGDQASANVKQAGEKAKDAVKDAVD